MAALSIKGSGIVQTTDFKELVYTGKTKNGKACVITLHNAINMSNIDLSMVEKDDAVLQLVFTAAYNNTDHMVSETADYAEPWEITYEGAAADAAAGTILLGAGTISVGGVDIALTRGGSSLSIEREFREINADGDRGPVKDRVVLDGSRATLTLNALTFLTHMADFVPAVTVTAS